MGRTRIEPKISTASFIYNGDKKAFDNFMEDMIHDYLNSSEMPKKSSTNFIEKVENTEKTEKPLDF